MLIAEGRDVLRHDLHTHSVQSACGIHSVAELLQIAAQKGTRTVNVCDHGSASGRSMNFGVLADPRRTPRRVRISQGPDEVPVRLLPGIEANILDDGGTDLPLSGMQRGTCSFALISAGFHGSAARLKENKDPEANLSALRGYVRRFPLDILTHPCIEHFPLPAAGLARLAREHGFALEVNNTNLTLGKTDLDRLPRMIDEARSRQVTLLCNSDGHTWFELFECGAVRAFVEGQMGLSLEQVFPLNFGSWQQLCDRFPRLASGEEAL